MKNLPEGTGLRGTLEGIAAEPMVPDALKAANEETDATVDQFGKEIKATVPDTMPGGM